MRIWGKGIRLNFATLGFETRGRSADVKLVRSLRGTLVPMAISGQNTRHDVGLIVSIPWGWLRVDSAQSDARGFPTVNCIQATIGELYATLMPLVKFELVLLSFLMF